MRKTPLTLFALACAIVAICAIIHALRPPQSRRDVSNAANDRRLSLPNGRVLTITSRPGFHNEPSVAINPSNPKQAIVAYQIGPKVAFTRDRGATWKSASGTADRNNRVAGDVSVAFDDRGNAYLCYIAFDRLGTTNYWARGATRNGVYVKRSGDGGATWEPTARTVMAQPTRPGIPFEDKPYIVSGGGNLYVGWTEFRMTESVILFSRSTDGGSTWSSAEEISSHHGLPRDDNGAVEGFSGTVGGDGTIYAAWADANSIAFTASRDGGKTFTHSREIIQTAPLYFAAAGLGRGNGFPQIGIDRTRGAQGRLYVAWSDYRNGDINVFVASSDNGGGSWSSPVRVNTNPVHDGTDQFFQWLAVDAVTGTVDVIFYDRRREASNMKTAVTLAQSADGGQSFKNYAWSRNGFTVNSDDFIGDYIGLAALNGNVLGAWAETIPAVRGCILRVGLANFGAPTVSAAHAKLVPELRR